MTYSKAWGRSRNLGSTQVISAVVWSPPFGWNDIRNRVLSYQRFSDFGRFWGNDYLHHANSRLI
ncbi:MAG: hypothetical protein KTR25_01470 [Myxococcales bacterium]|nr:hypothetical protein [Myxococcales bacterium]